MSSNHVTAVFTCGKRIESFWLHPVMKPVYIQFVMGVLDQVNY